MAKKWRDETSLEGRLELDFVPLCFGVQAGTILRAWNVRAQPPQAPAPARHGVGGYT